ncbi:protein kinase [Echinococcus multilocularis]|uniref:Protein kinase n=1 Tax=Echinococcus multilocularis TaxID=6211 RepID=A0A068Y2P1_ECHMU|nr:protein kinase [Echinococcus multilocularis]
MRTFHASCYLNFAPSIFCPFGRITEVMVPYCTYPVDGEVGLIEARRRIVPPPLSFKDCFISYTDVQLGEELGRGNFGVVYRGHILSMEVAVKKSLDLTNDAAFREEAKVMHKLSHQRIMGESSSSLSSCPTVLFETTSRRLIDNSSTTANSSALLIRLDEAEGREEDNLIVVRTSSALYRRKYVNGLKYSFLYFFVQLLKYGVMAACFSFISWRQT